MLLVAVLAGGHVMLTGLPGLGRTLLAKTLAKVLGLSYNRIQFTPDLLPSDIIGTEVLERGSEGGRHFRFFKGPIFSNLLLADEINRSQRERRPRLLEAMHEGQSDDWGADLLAAEAVCCHRHPQQSGNRRGLANARSADRSISGFDRIALSR